ncbi:flavodoxin [Tersicoccus solisilvae]|uniref:Flavodoxin n=1 Tax=Tersicoccus solisilvae TaxID=1882339 RepID=A0ABQ1P2M2_9MICC|nr:flavodoxin domain-containing protein [Tersicoccus solisilvae]GGC89136.1 flavodoxin [Tersicoccus solisilvae]
MTTLIAYASANGSTAQIARRIATVLEGDGVPTTIGPVEEAGYPREYDAVVLGSAVHHRLWLPAATAYVALHAEELVDRPLWLFSVGMIDALPPWVRGAALAGERRVLNADLRLGVSPRDHHVFSGMCTPNQWDTWGRLLFQAVGGHFGDYRNWAEVDDWAHSIGRALATKGMSSTGL